MSGERPGKENTMKENTMNRKTAHALALAIGAVLTVGATANAGLITNGDFSTSPSLSGDATKSITAFAPAGTWAGNDDRYDYDATNEVVKKVSNQGSAAILQWIDDDKASKGPGTLSFDVTFTNGDDLAVFVVGWNDGDTAPVIDWGNFDFEKDDDFAPNDSVDLLDEGTNETTHQQGGQYVDVGSLGLDSVNLDLGSGFDNLGVVFYGGANEQFSLDNVELSVIPEPATVALLGLGGALMLGRRRRA
jgi:hypothetical protein